MKISLFYITTPDEATATGLGQKAIENKLAACVNIFPMQSMYHWENELKQDGEFVLLLKTIPVLKERLKSLILEHHSYEVPCILNWDVEVNEAYREWIKEKVLHH